MLRFRLLGIPVTVEPWHWLVLAFIGNGLAIRDRETLIFTLLVMVAGFLSILVHEFGHALTGRKFGGRPDVVMHGFGGVARFPNQHFTRNQHLLVILAGPGVQLVLGGIAVIVLRSEVLPETPIVIFFAALAWVSIVWALLNLIPVYPLDGGQVMYQLIGRRRHVLCMKISMFTAIAAAIVLLVTTGQPIFPIILGFMAFQNYQLMRPRWR